MNRLKEIREREGFTQKGLAEISGVNLRTLQKYESGERDLLKAEVGVVIALADALEVTVYELLGTGLSNKENAVTYTMYLMAMNSIEEMNAEYDKYIELLGVDNTKAMTAHGKEQYHHGYAFATYLALKDLGFDTEKVENLRKSIHKE